MRATELCQRKPNANLDRFAVFQPGTRAIILLIAPSTLSAERQADSAAKLPMVATVEAQPLLSQAGRLREALEVLGEPLSEPAQKLLREVAAAPDDARAARMVQEALDPLCLAAVRTRQGQPLAVTVNPGRP